MAHFYWLSLTLVCWTLTSDLEASHVADEGDTTVEWPRRNPEITLLHYRSDIRFRFATVHVTSHVVNTAERPEEAIFEVRLPKAAFMTNFSMETDGNVQYGEIKDRQQARSNYARYKYKRHGLTKSNPSPQLADFKLFRAAVNIGPKKAITFNLTYQEFLPRRLAAYRHVIDLSPGQVIRDLKVEVEVTESRPIRVVRAPPLLTFTSTAPDGNAENELAHLQRPSSTTAHVTYRPSVRHQLQTSPQGITGQFSVEYDVTRDQSAGEIYASEEHFIHFFAPTTPLPMAKDILFILDVSMSMSGVKMEQTKVAMRSILGRLRSADSFNIITFSTALRFWRREGLMSVTEENIQSAIDFIQQMTASRGTNVNDALLRGIDMLQQAQMTSHPASAARASLILFLMDGQPTTGIVSSERILTNVRQANNRTSSLFCLGMDKGVDLTFLQKLAIQNGGRARLIYEDSDTALQLQGFYDELEKPLLTDVIMAYPGGTLVEGSVSKTHFSNYFDGSELYVTGRLNQPIRSLDTNVKATSASRPYEDNMRVSITQREPAHALLLERLWAYLTIQRLLETTTVTLNNTIGTTAKTRTLDLSLRYGFVTPLTSMVITKADQPHTNVGRLKDAPEKSRKGRKGGGLGSVRGSSQRRRPYNGGRKPFVDNDPHFMVMVKGLPEGICFDVDGQRGDVFQLIHDSHSGITINGQVVGKEPDPEVEPEPSLNSTSGSAKPSVRHRRTYFGVLTFLYRGGAIVVRPEVIHINRKRLQWHKSRTKLPGTARGVVHIRSKHEMTLTLGQGLVFVVLRHKVHQPHPTKVDYLGFYVEDGEGLSKKTHGLIGQFQHQTVRFAQKPKPTRNGHMRASLLLRGPHVFPHEVAVSLTRRRNMELNTHVPCWHVPQNGRGLLAGTYRDYIVSSLYHKQLSRAEEQFSSRPQQLLPLS